MDGLRALFPVCARTAYFNAGTDGPIPAAAAAAAREALDRQQDEGRSRSHFEARRDSQQALRAAYAELLGAPAEDVSLTTSTSEGLGKVLAGMDIGAHDEILTSDQEHPGLIGPLIAARRRGATVRTAPLAQLASAVTPQTTLVACSHVGWITGEVADPALAEVDVPVILDGAQGIGAVPVDVQALDCAAYAGAGQKWLCGADGTGQLYLAPALRERVRPIAPGYLAFADASKGLDSDLHADGRAYDTPSLSREAVALTLGAIRAIGEFGWPEVQRTAIANAERLAAELAQRGFSVAPRGQTTLVSWEVDDPEATAQRLSGAGILLRFLPGTGYLRASVGAWNDDEDIERLLEAL
jgi:L-cysteine/cystine lyase